MLDNMELSDAEVRPRGFTMSEGEAGRIVQKSKGSGKGGKEKKRGKSKANK